MEAPNLLPMKDLLSRILDELSSLKLWKEKQERKEKGKKRVEEISQDERKKIREEENSFNFKNIEIQLGQNIWELKLIVHSLEKKKEQKNTSNHYEQLFLHFSSPFSLFNFN